VYPELVTPAEVPNCIRNGVVALRLVPFIITVILFAQLGIPVKLMLLPADPSAGRFTAVASVIDAPGIVADPSEFRTIFVDADVGFLILFVIRVLIIIQV
jgi:hypothetical protein